MNEVLARIFRNAE